MPSMASCWGISPSLVLHRCSAGPLPSTAPRFMALPEEILVIISHFLAPADLLRLAQTCRTASKLVKQAAQAWVHSLKREWTFPRGLEEQLLRPLPSGTTWRDVCLGLRLSQPAVQRHMQGAIASQGTCIPCDTSQYPVVLHLNSTAQRTLQVGFPMLPAGRYSVVWRVRAARAFHRGYINFFAVFESGKATRTTGRSGCGGSPFSQLFQPRLSFRSGPPAAADQPGAGVAVAETAVAPAVAAEALPAPLQLAAELAAGEVDTEAAAGASVRGPPLPQLPWLAAIRSRLLGSYTSRWHLVDRATIRENAAAVALAGQPYGATLRVALSALEMPAQPGGTAAAAAAGNGPAAAAAGGDSGVWGDVVVGEVVLRRACAPRFVFAVLQVARSVNEAHTTAHGGVYVDSVQLRPLD